MFSVKTSRVVLTAHKPEKRLSNKHNTINYYRVMEAVAGKWICVEFESGMSNLVDFLKKILTIGKRKDILWNLTR